jgi:hypothetical protein
MNAENVIELKETTELLDAEFPDLDGTRENLTYVITQKLGKEDVLATFWKRFEDCIDLMNYVPRKYPSELQETYYKANPRHLDSPLTEENLIFFIIEYFLFHSVADSQLRVLKMRYKNAMHEKYKKLFDYKESISSNNERGLRLGDLASFLLESGSIQLTQEQCHNVLNYLIADCLGIKFPKFRAFQDCLKISK